MGNYEKQVGQFRQTLQEIIEEMLLKITPKDLQKSAEIREIPGTEKLFSTRLVYHGEDENPLTIGLLQKDTQRWELVGIAEGGILAGDIMYNNIDLDTLAAFADLLIYVI